MAEDCYYSDWDRWFAEKHDGTPVVFTVCEVECTLEDGSDVGHLSLCAAKGPGKRTEDQPGHCVGLLEEKHKVLHRFTASSSIEAAQKQYDVMDWGTYKPLGGWDVEEGRWTDTLPDLEEKKDG